MSRPTPPPEFGQLVRAFFQGSLNLVMDEQGSAASSEFEITQRWIAFTLQHVNEREKEVVKQFLDVLLSQGPKEEELQKLWNSSGNDYYIIGKHGHEAMRVFLTEIRDQIGQGRSVKHHWRST